MRILPFAFTVVALAGCGASGVPSAALRPPTNVARAASATFQTLYAFEPNGDGISPQAGLVQLHGRFYGTTELGGANGFGTVFEVSAKGKERVVYSFKGGPDGANPQANLIALGGVLYGTTAHGGTGSGLGQGTVFSVTSRGPSRPCCTLSRGGK